MKVDPTIFKAYDIRGIFPDQLNEKTAIAIGRAFVTAKKVDQVLVGRDMRKSSPILFSAIVEGIVISGADVIEIGMISTDQFYFSCASQNSAGVMVTASHNPPEYGGFKMLKSMPHVIGGETGLRKMQQIIADESYVESDRRGEISRLDLTDQFIDFVLSFIDVDSIRPIKIAVDPRSGMVGPIFQKVFDRLPIYFDGFNLTANGELPDDQGYDPMQPQNHADLQNFVKEINADVGFAFDGDGDRFFVVDDRGEFVQADFITALIAEDLLSRFENEKIVHDVRSSWAIRDTVLANGGTPIVERVGHSFIKPTMMIENAIFGGELSGHYYFRDFFYADSGIIPALILTEILSKKGAKLSELIRPYEEKYFLSGEINTRLENISPDEKIAQIREIYGKLGTIDELDGISIEFDDWHFNVRKSNTEPLIRLNLEAKSRDLMIAKRDEILTLIRS